jgi:hypothetical protein
MRLSTALIFPNKIKDVGNFCESIRKYIAPTPHTAVPDHYPVPHWNQKLSTVRLLSQQTDGASP